MQFAIHQSLSQGVKPTKHHGDDGCRVAGEGIIVPFGRAIGGHNRFILDAKGAYHGNSTTNQ